MSTYKISCSIGTTDTAAKLGLEIWVDNKRIFESVHVIGQQNLSFDLPDDESEHELRFVMTGKTNADTKVDETGKIIKDACLTVSNLAFEEIGLNQIVCDNAVYQHNFNGSGPLTEEKFYGTLGCNGSVTLKYSTPVYLWLLEKM